MFLCEILQAKTSVGLIRGHAYSITKVCKAKIDTGFRKKEYPLVRIRNPWGNEAEWNGAWSDGSEEWNFVPAEEKTAQGIVFEDDGEFFMSIEDFIKVMASLLNNAPNLVVGCIIQKRTYF